LVGGTLGYNWQMSRFVFGLEGDVSWVGEYGSHIDDGLAGTPLPGISPFQSFTKETWLVTARARFGYAVNNLLFYGPGGYAGAGVEAGVKDSATNALLVSSSSTRNGWTAGGGIEWGFAPAIWLYAGHTLLIAIVRLRLVSITPHLEQGDHLRHRQLSAVLLIVSSLLAIALSFVHSRVARWALALNFVAPLIRK
jgi:Outer membrane protein beta-barrel domain